MSFCSFFGGEVFKDNFEPGIYACSKCDHKLFSSRSKFEHSSPWPAFTETVQEDSVSKHVERPGAFKELFHLVPEVVSSVSGSVVSEPTNPECSRRNGAMEIEAQYSQKSNHL
uniref:Methionine sulfoxide reductase B1 n=1 Tax=Gadus morhua TaxID=8049 RepID=A0A8C5C1N4_GADMO